MEVLAREGPFEGGGDLLVVVLEAEDAPGDFVLGNEMSGGEGFALQDREVDLDLVEPARVRGQMHEGEVVELCLEPVDGALPAMDRAAVDVELPRFGGHFS